MVTPERTAACSGRSWVINDRAALVWVTRDDNADRTADVATTCRFKGADVGPVAGSSIGDAGVVNGAREAALIKCGAGRYPSIDRGTASRKRHRLGWTTIVRQRRQHWVGADLVASGTKAARISGDADEVMAIAGNGAVNVRSGSRSSGNIAGAVSSRITRNDCVFQGHIRWANADAAARTFRRWPQRLVSSALIDAAVAGLNAIQADRAVFDIQRGRIVVGDSAAVGEAACAVHAAVKSAISLSAVAAVTAIGEVVGKRRGVDDHGSTISEDGASARAAPVTGVVSAQAGRAERVAALAARCSREIESGVGHLHITQAIYTATISAAAGVGPVATRA